MLLGLGVSVLLGHAKVHNMDDIGGLRIWPTNKKVVRFDIAVNEVLFMYCLDTGKLAKMSKGISYRAENCTICFATITTVLMENLRLQ